MNKLLVRALMGGLGCAILAPTSCFAQTNALSGGGPTGLGAATQRNIRAANKTPSAPALPPVLPGTKGASVAAAPTQMPSDMSPTEGLFDAINRGDLPAARDAVNRGANLNGRNVLGLSPLDLSVDLGRNDISFMLLSMRGEDTTLGRDAGRRDTGSGGTAAPRSAARRRAVRDAGSSAGG